ncbi:MAG: Crp/Fnr family transcriptional regulator [Sphingomonas bacterium]|nr:Crp/Fnr family transcriptional regulator [Sphingomonas bacterium]
MIAQAAPVPDIRYPLSKLSALVPLDDHDRHLLSEAAKTTHLVQARREILREGDPIKRASLILNGWAFRARLLPDGRRQILYFLLPGDAIGLCRHLNPTALTTIVSHTNVLLCPAPEPRAEQLHTGLAEAYSMSQVHEEEHLLRHVTRLGRLGAYDRIIDWLLETGDRLALSGMGTPDRFPLPLTQEMIADTLGLTSVHVNRMLQLMARDKLVRLRNGTATLMDRAACVRLVDYTGSKARSRTTKFR